MEKYFNPYLNNITRDLKRLTTRGFNIKENAKNNWSSTNYFYFFIRK